MTVGKHLPEQAVELTLWPGNIGGGTYTDHVRAAEAGSFSGLAIHPRTYMDACASGLSGVDLRNMAEDAGVAIRHLDIVTNWVVPAKMEDRPPSLHRYDASLDACFDMVDTLGIATINVIPAFRARAIEHARLVEAFAAMCDRAARHGACVDLEFMPFWGIPDLASAWSIVGAAGRPNGGILVDTWHFCRSGSALALLDAIPGEHLRTVQVADGPATPGNTDLYAEAMSSRRFIGDGELPNAEIVERLAARGHLRHLGAEMFNKDLPSFDAAEVGTRLGAGLRTVARSSGLAGF